MTDDAQSHWRLARRFLESARVLVDAKDPDSAASRAYYSAFHAVSAWFAVRGTLFRKHEAVESAVHRDLVRTGIVLQGFG